MRPGAVFVLEAHYPSGRTWANICSSSGCASLVKRRAQDVLCKTSYLSYYLVLSRTISYYLSFVSLLVRRSRRISKYSSSRRIIRLVPVFILETHNQTNYKCLLKFVQTDNVSGIKTANKIVVKTCQLQ